MKFIYPAIFERNDDESYTITFPDLPGCISEGKSLENALDMAQKGLLNWIEFLVDDGQVIPNPSNIKSITVSTNQFVNLIQVDLRDNRAVRRTVSIPSWMDLKAIESGISLSKILQDALRDRFEQDQS